MVTVAFRMNAQELSELDQHLQELFGQAPVPPPRLVAVPHEPPATPAWMAPSLPPPLDRLLRSPDGLYLDQLPTDALCEVYKHVELPFVLKLACHALREAGPKQTETTLSHIGKSSQRFQWAYRVGCPFVWDAKLAAKLACHGCVGALMWAHKEGMRWDAEVCTQAARGGHVDLVAMLIKFHCPFDVDDMATTACYHGQVNLLVWLSTWHNVPWRTEYTQAAARYGHLETLKFLRSASSLSRPPCPWTSWTVTNAAVGGHLAVIEWATANGARMRSHAMVAAAENGHFELVRWMRERNLVMVERVCSAAASNGHLEILQYLRSGQFPCPWDAATSHAAAKHGHLRVLRWAMEHGCPVTFSTWTSAATWGRVHILRYLRAGGHPLQNVTCADLRDEGTTGHFGLNLSLAWMERMRSPWQRVRFVIQARAIARYWQSRSKTGSA